MKIITVHAILVFLSLAPLQAQISIEVQSGVNIASLSDPGNLSEDAVWKIRPGLLASITTNISINEDLVFSSGVRYIHKGMTSEFLFPGEGIIRGNLRLRYVEVPLYIKYKIIDSGTKVFIAGGPALSYLWDSKLTASSDAHETMPDDLKTKYKEYDASIDAGISTLTPLNADVSILVTALYSYGIVNISDRIYDDTGWSIPTRSAEQTRDIRLSIGAAYSIK